jgi:hypothetical protein
MDVDRYGAEKSGEASHYRSMMQATTDWGRLPHFEACDMHLTSGCEQ